MLQQLIRSAVSFCLVVGAVALVAVLLGVNPLTVGYVAREAVEGVVEIVAGFVSHDTSNPDEQVIKPPTATPTPTTQAG